MNRRPILSLLFFALLSSACAVQPGGSGGEGGGGGGGGGGGDDGWGPRTDIQAIFQNDCSGCHGSAWSSCWDVHDAASTLEGMIAGGAMPRGQPMAPSDKAAVLAWLDDGATCVGPQPDAGPTPLMTSAPTP